MTGHLIGNRRLFTFWLQLSIISITVARPGQGSRTSCGGTYTRSEGKIKSPGYPGNNYPARSNCLYKIIVPRGLRVRVKFHNFSVEPAGTNPVGICYDYVEVHDGLSFQNRSLGKFCGSVKPFSIFSTSNAVLVRFHSDRSKNYKGFQFVYHAKPLPRNQQGTLPSTTDPPTTARVVHTTKPSCPPGKFQCRDGQCIDANWRCDRYDDCRDMSDEQNCPCRSNQMTCANGGCVSKIWICDGSDDCGDNSDEKNCSVPTSSPLKCSVNNGGCQHKCTEVFYGKRKTISCSCMRGYKLQPDGKNCTDIDGCKVNNGGCHQVCLNTDGGHVCACRKGYFLTQNKINCEDINECASNNGGCNHDCMNTAGSFHCRCYPGFEFKSSNNKTCRDINECDINNGGCSHSCLNSAGSYECQCPAGYRLMSDNKTCEDINECAANKGGCEQECKNTLGSFMCRCRDGYLEDIMDPFTCIDIDECAEGIPACFDCVNTPGSYECNCDSGFRPNNNKTQCLDVDECASQNGGCGEHKCFNNYGSYSCQCNPGFQLDPNRSTNRCVDIDECATSDFKGDCDHICKNTLGSYKCECRDGYKLRARTKCFDINECEENAHQCQQHNCTNSDGSYTCSCKKGFFLSIDGHSCGTKKELQECGIAPLASKTFPGRWHQKQESTWPWTALLYFSVLGDIEGCMATLIDKEWLITTAHCLHLGQRVIPAKYIKVELGAFTRGNSHHKLVLHDVSQIVIHQDFQQNFTLNLKVLSGNIALVRLAKPIEITEKLRPICLPTRNEVALLLGHGTSRDGVVLGWGKTSEHRVRSTLHEVAVSVQRRSRCKWAKMKYEPVNMVCAGFNENQKTPCVGDSGSPLMFPVSSPNHSTPKWVLGGVMSWGLNVLPEGCHRDYRYTVYTRVGPYLEWIKFWRNRGNKQ